MGGDRRWRSAARRLGLPHHLGRVFVETLPEETGVTQLPVTGPLGEADLSDQLGTHPVGTGFPNWLGER